MRDKRNITLSLALLALSCLFWHAESSLLQIVPNKSSCMRDLNCTDFEMFLQNSSSYIASNTVLRFYPTVYSTQTTDIDPGTYRIVISGLTNITIDGRITSERHKSKRAKILCTNDFKVVWIILYCSNVNIKNIELVDCSCETFWPSSQENMRFTLFTVDTSNLTFEYFHVSTVQGEVLISLNTVENLRMLHSKVKGVTLLKYSHFYVKATTVYVMGSQIESVREIQQSSQVGLRIILEHNYTAPISLKIFHTTFQGLDDECGYVLQVQQKTLHCTALTVTLMDTQLIYGGLVLSQSYDSCNRRSTAVIINTQLGKICSTACSSPHLAKETPPQGCGLTVIHYNLTMENSTISNSMKGLELFMSVSTVINSTFTNNMNALYCDTSSVTLRGGAYFVGNEQGKTGYSALYVKDSFMFLEDKIVVENNNGGKYGAFMARNSTMYIRGNITFTRNQGFYGGAMSLYSYSILNINTTAMLVFNNNRAWKNGGAIYVDRETYINPPIAPKGQNQCFFYLPSLYIKVFFFCNNTAVQGGDAIYSESLRTQCYMRQSTTDEHSLFMAITDSGFLTTAKSCNPGMLQSLTSSDAAFLCFCNSTHTDCVSVEKNVSVVPGQTIKFSAIAKSTLVTPAVLGTAHARLLFPYDSNLQTFHPHISHQQMRQILPTTCTKLEYTIHAPEGTNQTLIIATRDLSNEDISASLAIYKIYPFRTFELNDLPEIPLYFHITVQQCLTGYILKYDILSCECHPYLTQAGIRCLISNQTVIRSGTVWINATNDTVIIHRYCPLGYCKTQQTELSLTDPSTQCSFQRSGTLCGQCRQNLSQMLGSSDCQECSNLWLLLVIPMTIVSGIVLVIFLMSFNLTVATGTINGLIFYANIIRANNAIYFSTQRYISTRICNVFIAWANLDVGIAMCFYNGLTAYVKTVFQLTFPLYIFTLVAIIIISSHYSTRAARLSGTNAVPVLATLFLLTYSKSVRFVITALQPSTLTIQHYPNNTNTTNLVWLYDGNVDYLQGKHIFLFLLGLLILVLVSFPYTTVLILIQCLQRRSHHKCLSWVWKMSPLFDAYTGPYKTKHRYWTGLLLLLRVALFAVFSLNISGDPSINLLATLIVMLLTLGYIAMVGQMYKSKALSVLECVFLLNLTILSASSLFALQTNRDQEVITNISVILSMVLFCGILVLHIYKRIVSLKVTKRWMKKVRKRESEEETRDDDNGQMEKKNRIVTRQVVSIKDLEEPLIESMDQTVESNETQERELITD